jgi:hypothetical protein
MAEAKLLATASAHMLNKSLMIPQYWRHARGVMYNFPIFCILITITRTLLNVELDLIIQLYSLIKLALL